jgi:amidase
MAWLRLQAVAAVFALVAAAGVSHGFEFQEATLDSIHLGFTNGSLTSEALVQSRMRKLMNLKPIDKKKKSSIWTRSASSTRC